MHQKFWFYEKKVGTMMTVLFLVLFLGFFGSVTAQVKKQGQLKVKQAKQLQKALTLEKQNN